MGGTLAMHPMRLIGGLFGCLSLLPKGTVVLWCYLIWYVVVVVHHFDPSPALWFNTLGTSAVIGFALLLSVGGSASRTNDPWQTVRLFLLPFCVSSFSSLIKGKGSVLVFPPTPKLSDYLLKEGPIVLLDVRTESEIARGRTWLWYVGVFKQGVSPMPSVLSAMFAALRSCGSYLDFELGGTKEKT